MRTNTARQRVLAFLARRDTVTATQIALALNMSAATIRHHLAILQADGRIVSLGKDARGKPGRPQILYRLSDRLRGENFAILADILLRTWLQVMPKGSQDAVVQALAHGLTDQVGGIDVHLSVPKQLVELTEKLNSLHYQARWEAGASGPRILFGHCPYAEIIAEHPELCRMDALLLSNGMNADIEQLSKIDRKPAGVGVMNCVFSLRLRSSLPSR